MISEAQKVINILCRKDIFHDEETFNDKLIRLFHIIPRSMRDVNDHLLDDINDEDSYSKVIEREQNLLDVMQSQVGLVSINEDGYEQEANKDLTILNAIGIRVKPCNEKEVLVIEEMIRINSSISYKMVNALRVEDVSQQKSYDDYIHNGNHSNKTQELLWHGSRTENWVGILQEALMIRPSNAVLSGSMFGNGCYFSSVTSKSTGYTSLSGSHWAGGSSNSGFLGLFNVHVGNAYKVDRWESEHSYLDYEKLQQYGRYDSLYAPAGYDLRNDEFIIYKPEQCTIKYLIEITQ